MGAFVFNCILVAVILLAGIPLTIYGVRFARKYRKTASTAATLLLVFGIGMQASPPPPPSVEAAQREEEEAEDDEPI